MFWKAKKARILVFRNKLQLSIPESDTLIVFPFPTLLISNLELIDQIGFEKALQQFLEQNKISQYGCSLFLDETFMFWKKQDANTQDEHFFELIPLPQDQRAHRQIQIDDMTIISGYNSAIIASIQRALHVKNNIVKSIFPFYTIPSFESETIDITTIDEKTIRKFCHFNSEIMQFKSLSSLLPIPLFIGLGSFIILVGIGGMLLLLLPQQKQKVLPQKKIVKTLSPTPKIVFPNPEDIRIDILNGSGRFGEAGKLKTSLESGGYTIASVGNADADSNTTLITSKKIVSPDFTSSLKQLLAGQYIISTNSSTLLESTSSADIVVVIGIQKTPAN